MFCVKLLKQQQQHPFYGHLSRTIRVIRYQKGKTNIIYWSKRQWVLWHYLGHMQICTWPRQITMPAPRHLVSLQARCPILWLSGLSGTTWVSQYQKKHSPTYICCGHQSSLICFLHLLRSMASSLFNLCAWQSFPQSLSFLWSTSWPGTLHFILHTFLHPITVFFLRHMPIPFQTVLL